jgi:PmbA protein
MNPKMNDAMEAALDAAEKAGAGGVEVYAEEREETTIRIHHGRIQTLNVSGTGGVGVRVFRGNRYAFVSSCDLDAVVPAVRRAVEDAAEMDPDEAVGLPEPSGDDGGGRESFDPGLGELPAREKADALMRIESAVKTRDDRIRPENFTYRDAVSAVRILSSAGLDREYRSSSFFMFGIASIREKDRGGRGHFVTDGIGPNDFDTVSPVEKMVRRVRTSLEGASHPPRKMTVVFDPEAAAAFARSLQRALDGGLAAKGQSFLSGQVGERVASSRLTLVDDRTLPGRFGTGPYDDEGLPARRNVLVEEGILKGYLCDTYWGRRLGSGSTASAARAGYATEPFPAASNFFIAPGEGSLEDLLGAVDDGFYLIDMMSVGGINPVTGLFSAAACGFRIKKGEVTDPVAGVTVAGKIPDMLRGVEGVGAELGWSGNFGAPPLAVPDMTVGGK